MNARQHEIVQVVQEIHYTGRHLRINRVDGDSVLCHGPQVIRQNLLADAGDGAHQEDTQKTLKPHCKDTLKTP